MAIPVTQRLFVAAEHYQPCVKYAAAEAVVNSNKSAFKDAVNGLLSDSATSQQNVKELYEKLGEAGHKKAQKKIIDYFAKFSKEKNASRSTQLTVDNAYNLGVDFNCSRESLRTEEYKNDRKLRKEFKAAIPAETAETDKDIEQIVDGLKANGFSEFIIERAKAFANKPVVEQSKELEKQNKQAFFAFIKG